MTFALSHPITWFRSTTRSVTADWWTDDSDHRFAHFFHFGFVFIEMSTKFATCFPIFLKITVHTRKAIQSVSGVVVISLVFWVNQKTILYTIDYTNMNRDEGQICSFTCLWWTATLLLDRKSRNFFNYTSKMILMNLFNQHDLLLTKCAHLKLFWFLVIRSRLFFMVKNDIDSACASYNQYFSVK